ncbi:RluA family pseudouridine synthase [Candidatus Saccharibacteria bacterium]|nr:RluA family pseudouridine synthase [Candidatus Saccharibacteria bacterium]
MRLDAHIASVYPDHSRSTWKKIIEAGQVKVNGVVEVSPKYDVKESDKLDVEIPETPDHSSSSLPVIYEDENVIVIDKPLGVLTHSKGALNDEFTVAEFVRSKTSYKQDTNRPGIIHRLDRATSGVIICVKNDETARSLSKQFTDRTVKKQYVAVTSAIPKESEAIIDLPIARNPSAPSTFRIDPKGKQAETYYKITDYSDSHALVTLNPKTGRTHQLRVHLAYVHAPIVGDTIYGSETADRMYLHANTIELTLSGGKRMTFESRVPSEFKRMVSQ